MGKRTASERQPDATLWITNYRPRGVDADAWNHVRPFVVEVLDRFLRADVESTALLARTVTRLALWCVVQRISLDVEVVLDPDTVERYCSLGLASGRSRGTYRSLLRKIGPLVTRTAPWAPPPPSICERRVAAPYRASELAAL